MSIDLVNRSVAEMFTISDADWEAISTRVDAVIHLSGVADEVTQYLPGFKALLGQCQLWRDHTLNEIGSSATQLVGYCNQAIDRFGALQTVLAGPLTPAGQQEVVDTLRALAGWTIPLNTQFHELCGRISDFAEINHDVDAQVDAYVAKLGPSWQSIMPQVSRVDDAAGQVRGVWEALAADLNALVSEPIDVTDQFVAGLSIQAALRGWTDLREEAQAYLSTHEQQVPA